MGQKYTFGFDKEFGIRLERGAPEVVTIGENGVTEDDLMVHDEHSLVQAFALAQMFQPAFPEPLGVIYVNSDRQSYESASHEQMRQAVESHPHPDLQELVKGRQTWTID